MQRLTDTYGPIPYKSINSTSLTVAYDSQEDVYRAMFDDLNAAIEVFDFLRSGQSGSCSDG